MIDFAKNLKSLRQSEGLAQQELADRLAIKRSTLAMYERGKRLPRYYALGKIAKYFSVSVDYLLGNCVYMKGENHGIQI